MTILEHLKAIHSAKTSHAVAGALGRASRQLGGSDALGMAIVRAEARGRILRLTTARIRTARDLRRLHAAR